jgi:uncharacterized lipoprotein YajG
MGLRIKIISILFSSIIFSQDIKISDVQNNIQFGPMVGDQTITFGVKNILEELIQDEGYDLNPNSNDSLLVEIAYYGKTRKEKNIAIYTKKENIVEIVAFAKINEKGKIIKATGVGKDMKSSLVILNNEGELKRSSINTALRKMCEQIIKKLKL